MSLRLLLIATLALSCLSTSIFKQQDGALAQQYIQTKVYENITAFNLFKCNYTICPILMRSISSLIPNISIIGNVSKSTGILMLNGENDSQTPVQQAFLLQQRLTELNHPDHTLITYPNLGHVFYPSSRWSTGIGPIQEYVLADLYAWLEAHSGISHSYVNTTADSNLET
jgi:hypothetical protein